MKPGTDISIGIDIADERQFQDLARNDAALRKMFSDQELAECVGRDQDQAAALARRFAAKEALMKAAGTIAGIPARIEILHDEAGAPFPRWEYLERNGLHAEISMSSASPFAIAVAVIRSGTSEEASLR